jgi:hypothetical protein
LKEIEISNMDFKEFLIENDFLNREDALLFVDPPYIGKEDDYLEGYSGIALDTLKFLHEEINFKGKVIFTHNLTPSTHNLSVSKRGIKKLLIMLKNYGYEIVKEVPRQNKVSRKRGVYKEFVAVKI